MRCLNLFMGCLALLIGGSCGGSSAAVVLLGPFLVDFEARPDDGFEVVATPVFLGNGATITDVTNGTLYDFTTADGYGFGSCAAIATSGVLMMGAQELSVSGVVTQISFNPPVARVSLAVGDTAGQLVILEARDVGSTLLDSDSLVVSTCPVTLLPLTVDAGDSNLIASVRISGSVTAWDDLQTWRWSQ